MSLAVQMSAESTPLPPAPVPIYRSLFVQVFAALVLGIVLGMGANLRRRAQNSQRRVSQADFDDRRADRLLRGRSRYSRGR